MAAIRAAAERDLPAITEIYNQAVLRSTGTFDTEPKTLAQQKEWFAKHGASHPVVVADESGAVLGWASVSAYSDRCAYAATAEVSVYIDEKARGKGLGGALLDGVLTAAKKAGIKQILARITEDNAVSLKLHAKRGFFEAGRLRAVGEKFGKTLDVFILQKSLALALLILAAPAYAGVEDALRDSAVRLSAGDVAGARAKAAEAASAAPRDPRGHEMEARAALAALDYGAALKAASRALALGENTARLALRSEARAGLGDFNAALADAERAVKLSPGSGPARLRLAAAKEGLGRPASETLADYRRAAELDASLDSAAYAAEERLSPPPARHAGAQLGPILVILVVSALIGWVWGRANRAPEELAAESGSEGPAPLLPGSGKLSPRAAMSAVAAAARRSPDSRELGEALYRRLTGRPAFPRDTDRALGRYIPASELAKGLPAGIDTFFARALDPDAARRFQSASELAGAFRSLVDPAIL